VRPTEEQGPSKTRRKREAEALQSLGEALAELPDEALDQLDLPERLRQALQDLRGISAHEARRRQRQFIGRLMRDVDPGPLREFIAARERPSREAARLFRLTEDWRDRLVTDGEPALREFLVRHPAVDEAALSRAIEDTRSGRSGAPKRLFRLVKTILEQHAAGGQSRAGESLLE
jgi:ribosome-associated protein